MFICINVNLIYKWVCCIFIFLFLLQSLRFDLSFCPCLTYHLYNIYIIFFFICVYIYNNYVSYVYFLSSITHLYGGSDHKWFLYSYKIIKSNFGWNNNTFRPFTTTKRIDPEMYIKSNLLAPIENYELIEQPLIMETWPMRGPWPMRGRGQ